ncbi:hypothetical protein AAHA92_24702 [Salvia divinorum]|uniref:Uncharacterized protein n=1 Tax=Salvia divinorum TaxID=28513 RepID=A0ABD1G886_SALDI
MLIGTAAFVYHEERLSSNPVTIQGMESRGSNAMTPVLKSRKLKESRESPTPDKNDPHLNLEDYCPLIQSQIRKLQ